MSLYIIRPTDTREDIPIKIVNNSNWGGTQQVIVYEAAGTNGGVAIVTGRTNNTVTLNGQLLVKDKSTRTPLVDLNEQKNVFLRLKNKGIPVILIAPVDNDDTGVYLISEFSGNVVEGMSNSLPFTMTLTEYRQSNLKRTLVNLISFEPAEEFKAILASRTGGSYSDQTCEKSSECGQGQRCNNGRCVSQDD